METTNAGPKTSHKRCPLPALRTARHERAVTIEELSGLSGMRSGSISELENLRRGANPGSVRKLSRALGVDPRVLTRPPAGDAPATS